MKSAALVDSQAVSTQQFSLRPISQGDEPLYRALYCDAETMRYVGLPLSFDEAARSFRSAVRQTATYPAEAQFLVVVDATDGEDLGICGVRYGLPRLGMAEVGIMLTGGARRLGLSHDAFGSFIDHVFSTTAVLQVWVRYSEGHEAVDRMMLGLDFRMGAEWPEDESAFRGRAAFVCRESWLQFVPSINRG